MDPKKLSGKIALVTGSSRGIGRAMAERLSRDGASVAINYVSHSDKAEEVVAAIASNGGTAISLQADVSRLNDIQRLFEQTLEHFGRLDIVVNNAGVRISKNVTDIVEEEFDRLFAINVKGTFFSCQLAARRLSDSGRIINVSSAVTRMMLPGYSIYSASKGAVDQITRVLAKELGGRQITVNAVAPGPVDTQLFRDGKTEEQIQDARWITGQTIHVNGGFV
jgi:3-oxoacyl-[acyl-carrier protein] reductase